jgi:hypothetical protein
MRWILPLHILFRRGRRQQYPLIWFDTYRSDLIDLRVFPAASFFLGMIPPNVLSLFVRRGLLLLLLLLTTAASSVLDRLESHCFWSYSSLFSDRCRRRLGALMRMHWLGRAYFESIIDLSRNFTVISEMPTIEPCCSNRSRAIAERPVLSSNNDRGGIKAA